MFLLYTIEDKIILKPDSLNKTESEGILYEDIVLNKTRDKYIGKVLLNHGIVVSIKKLMLKSNMIVEIEGVINVEYEMELIVFRPQIGDLLYGRITSSERDYITVDCDVIKVKVPVEQLMKPNSMEENDNIWFWKYDDACLYYDIGEKVRLKVVEINFKTSHEINKLHAETTNAFESQETPQVSIDTIMSVLCTFNQEGLGPIKWWES